MRGSAPRRKFCVLMHSFSLEMVCFSLELISRIIRDQHLPRTVCAKLLEATITSSWPNMWDHNPSSSSGHDARDTTTARPPHRFRGRACEHELMPPSSHTSATSDEAYERMCAHSKCRRATYIFGAGFGPSGRVPTHYCTQVRDSTHVTRLHNTIYTEYLLSSPRISLTSK